MQRKLEHSRGDVRKRHITPIGCGMSSLLMGLSGVTACPAVRRFDPVENEILAAGGLTFDQNALRFTYR
jgi:hypothetical protein